MGIPEPFWMMLGVAASEKQVLLLGWSERPEDEARAIAQLRAPGMQIRLFDISKPAASQSVVMRTWLTSFGMSDDEAKYVIRDMANKILDGLKTYYGAT